MPISRAKVLDILLCFACEYVYDLKVTRLLLFNLTITVQNKVLLQSEWRSTHPKCKLHQKISSNSYKKIGSRSDRFVYAAAVKKNLNVVRTRD